MSSAEQPEAEKGSCPGPLALALVDRGYRVHCSEIRTGPFAWRADLYAAQGPHYISGHGDTPGEAYRDLELTLEINGGFPPWAK